MASRIVSFFRSKAENKSKLKIQAAAKAADILPFVPADGLDYEKFFRTIHKKFLFDWYMEIGCRTGEIFAQARGKTIAIDPYFLVTTNAIGLKPALYTFQSTSDEFFASKFLDKNNILISLSFLDGMHLLEYLLSDFINTERYSRPDGVIVMHDCCPYNMAMTTRDLDNLPEGAWTGDVWKLLPILQQYRPDLKITVLNCATTGLVLVSSLAPNNETLKINYDAIIKTYRDLDLEAFGIEAFYSSFNYTDAQAYLDAGAPEFAKVAQDASHVLKPVFVSP